jgi:hypothetical protein
VETFLALLLANNKMKMNTRLKKGQHGWITQEILDFVYYNGEVSYKEMDVHYQTVCQGKPEYSRSSSFNHHLESLVKPSSRRRCRRYLIKGSNGKYTVGFAFTATDILTK